MKIDLAQHGRPGTLLAICGFDGSGKSTLEAGLLAALAPTRSSVPAAAPTGWWRQDANVQRTLYGHGAGRVLPEEALLHFNLADCHVHQADVVIPALARGELVVGTRYLFDMLALFEARGLTLPTWVRDAVADIVRPDFCFVLDGSAELFVDRIVRRDGLLPGRFDQDVAFVGRYNAALRRMAEANDLTILPADAEPDWLLQQCLAALSVTASV
jgi:thymidylate kinase